MNDDEKFVIEINSIIQFLNLVDASSYFEQMSYLNLLIDLIRSKQYDSFFKKVNSSELWGGSGSIWESEYGMSVQQRQELEGLLIILLMHLKRSNKMDKQAKGVFNILTVKNK